MAQTQSSACLAATPASRVLFCLFLASGTFATAADPVAFRGLGFMTDTDGFSQANGISADGTTVVGASTTEDSWLWSYRWTESSGMVALPKTSPGDVPQSQAHSVSANGGIIIGLEYNFLSTGTKGYRWTSSGGVVLLPYLAGFPDNNFGTAEAISADGSVVAGSGPTPFRWTESGGTQTIPLLGSDDFGFAHGISSDGSIIVGSSGFSNPQAYRWSEQTGTQGLIIPGADWSDAMGICGNGSTIVGVFGQTASSTQSAFAWTELGVLSLTSLSMAEGTFTSVIAASETGMWAVGESDGKATLWNTTTGAVWDLNVVIAGQSDFDGWQLQNATGISADGKKIVGNGMNENGHLEAWMIDLNAVPEPSAPILLGSAIVGWTLRRRRSSSGFLVAHDLATDDGRGAGILEGNGPGTLA